MAIELSTLTFTDEDDIIFGEDIFFGDGIVKEPDLGFIDTGDGNDIILGLAIYNSGAIYTSDGNDLIISPGVIYNAGTINTGNGNDSIIADEGFQQNSPLGIINLGEGDDYINGFGSGLYLGGSGNDILELTPGSYTIQLTPGPTLLFKDDIRMTTFEFDKLIAGSTSYDFTSLTDGQTIIVA
jgi:hypothetical protein